MLTSDFQKLSVLGLVTLYEIDATRLGGGIYYFHGHVAQEDWRIINPQGEGIHSIIWQGQEYAAQRIETSGLEMRGDGKASNPVLGIGNSINGQTGAVSALCHQLDDFAGAKVTIIRTLAKYLDAANFKDGNPLAANEHDRQRWTVEQKTSERSDTVSFELANPTDLEGSQFPNRAITGYCHWCANGEYRGEDCGYMGTKMFLEDGTPTTDINLDRCGGRVRDCVIRFGEGNEIRHGGFPSSSL